MKSYRITCLFQADWQNIIPAVFGANVPDSSQISGNIGVFNFSAEIIPNNLGPLVIVEESAESTLFP